MRQKAGLKNGKILFEYLNSVIISAKLMMWMISALILKTSLKSRNNEQRKQMHGHFHVKMKNGGE